ncbi:hypothetical protein ACQP2H_22745 [Micromonospora sp. CA-248260]|uniref:hypothetical protein n=1 Tax=Micromonospora sp. CA-248260 TaxID=3239962 RepID=UPI003D8F44BC
MPRVYFVETSDGVFIQATDAPSPIAEEGIYTQLVEERVREAASAFAVPDFVFDPLKVSKGGAVREVTDALIIASDLALSVQVKARDPLAASGDADKEGRWIKKHAAKGVRQAEGSLRAMIKTGGGRFVNRLGREVDISFDRLIVCNVVVIDHPDPPKVLLEVPEAKNPTLILLRYEWEFLIAQLRSVHGLHRYVHGVALLPAVPLGDELARFNEQVIVAGGLWSSGSANPDTQVPLVDPTLPLIRMGESLPTCEEFWRNLYLSLSECRFKPEHEWVRLETMARFDRLPFSMREEIANHLTSRLRGTGSQLDFFVVQEGSSHTQFVFGVTEVHPSESAPRFEALTHLQHGMQPLAESGGVRETIGIMFYGVPQREPAFTITVVPLAGPSNLTPTQAAELARFCGVGQATPLWPK